jgi:hypothetical protein
MRRIGHSPASGAAWRAGFIRPIGSVAAPNRPKPENGDDRSGGMRCPPPSRGLTAFPPYASGTRPTDPNVRSSEMSNLTRISRGRDLPVSRGRDLPVSRGRNLTISRGRRLPVSVSWDRSLTISRGRRLPAIASQHAVVVPDIPVALIDVSEGCSLLSPVGPTADRRQATAFHSYIRTASEIGSLRRLRTG